MGSYLVLIFGILTLCMVGMTYALKTARKKRPPGPLGIPFVGFLFHMMIGGETYQKKLLSVKKKYGKVATVRMGSFQCIWLNDAATVKEAFGNPIFCGRPKIEGITSRTHGLVGGLIFNDGPDFKEQRRFVTKHLKNLGFGGKMSMELNITEEATEVVRTLELTNGEPNSTRHLFNVAIMNVLWKIIAGEKYPHDDPTMMELADTLNKNMELNGGTKVAFFMPWLTSIFPAAIGWTSYVKDATLIFNFWRDYSKAKMQSYKGDSIPEFFIDYYIRAILECTNPNSGFYGERGVLSLATIIQDLFIAGTETTSTTLTWGLLYLAMFPRVQENVAKEVNKVIGISCLPDLNCRLRMPYTEAFLQELMRHCTLAPLGIVHRATEDTELCGFFIPKDSMVQANISAIHNDPEVWENPEEFRPERFMNDNLQSLVKKEGYLPFSYGGRHCIGETLARDELFLFLTSIVQHFHILPDPRSSNPSLVPVVGVGSIPQPHKLVFRPRANQQ